MSDAAIIAMVSGYVLLVGGYIPLVWKCLGYANALQEMDDERDKAVQRAAHLEGEHKALADKLADAERTIEALAKEPHEKPNADLDARDVRERVRRAAEEARAARRGEIPAGAEGQAVHPASAGADADAAEVLPAGPLDPNESLL